MSELLALMDAEALKMLLAIFVSLALSAWGGRVLGRKRTDIHSAQDEGLKIVLGATLSLFGLLMGFLLSFAISGYNSRVSAEENEAMALGNAFQRTTLLPSSAAQEKAEALLQQYLAARIQFYATPEETARAQLRMQSIHLQTTMWSFVSDVAKQAPNPVSMSLVEACNQLYITQQKAMASWRHQIPLAAWLVLMVFGICSNFLIGHHMRGERQGLGLLLVVPFVTALALFMIAEIDVPGKGVIHVTPQNLEALRVTLAQGGLAP